jgi:TonB family protein
MQTIVTAPHSLLPSHPPRRCSIVLVHSCNLVHTELITSGVVKRLTEVAPAMFVQFKFGPPKRQAVLLCSSLAVHFLFLGWILHSPAPIFVAPQEVTKGDGGSTLTRIYFGGQTGVTQAHPEPHRFLRQPNIRSLHQLPPLSAKMQKGNATASSLAPEGAAAGSAYGSLSYGSLAGFEVRPALPVVSFDPVIQPDLLNGITGDVIIEITIDSVGNITDMKVLQSFNPAVDQKVLAALEKWHFFPATRNGVPIPSKQDVHYHFPR